MYTFHEGSTGALKLGTCNEVVWKLCLEAQAEKNHRLELGPPCAYKDAHKTYF